MKDSRLQKNETSHIALPNPAQTRILLWDIDGTLMHSTRAGAYKEYFAPALEKVYGSAGRLAGMQVAGMTDTQIALEALRDEGFTVERIFAEKERLLDIFKQEMARVIGARDNPYGVFPGVREIVEKTDADPRYFNALLTGNLSVAAEIKLRYVDLWRYFEKSPNIFGEISHDRSKLAVEAHRLFSEFFAFDFRPEQFIIIGDTPNDIVCARAVGARVVSVATGRNHSREELAKYAPDVIFDDLSDAESFLDTIARL